MSAPIPIVALFERTKQGLLAAQVEDLAWLAVPVADGFKMKNAWRLRTPIADWVRLDFHGADGVVADEVAFRAHVEAIAEHRRQLRALDRRTGSGGVQTPWGAAQHSEIYAEGIAFYSTASHGDFHLDDERNAAMPDCLRNADGWYEEDEQWAKVAFAFPALFTERERSQAEKTLRDWQPDAWEILYGRKLDPSESYTRDRQHFEAVHAHDWIVVAASRSDDHPGQVECAAILGGSRGNVPVRNFLVPADEYSIGRHGFVIDEKRHPKI